MVLYKHNPDSGTYDPYTVPDGWYITAYTNPGKVANCAACGAEVAHDYAYESREILFSPSGCRVVVCMECYYKELYQKRIVRKEVIEE